MLPNWLIRFFDAFSRPFEPPAPPQPVEPLTPTPAAPVPELATAINAARVGAGLPPLAFDPALARVSDSWARSMAGSGTLDHGRFADRVESVYPNTAAGEDIAEGQPTPSDVVAAWLDDPPHRANLLGGFNRLGVGLARADDGTPYWVADFVQVD